MDDEDEDLFPMESLTERLNRKRGISTTNNNYNENKQHGKKVKKKRKPHDYNTMQLVDSPSNVLRRTNTSYGRLEGISSSSSNNSNRNNNNNSSRQPEIFDLTNIDNTPAPSRKKKKLSKITKDNDDDDNNNNKNNSSSNSNHRNVSKKNYNELHRSTSLPMAFSFF